MRTTCLLLILAVVAVGSGCEKTETPPIPPAVRGPTTQMASPVKAAGPATTEAAMTEWQVVAEIRKLGGTVTGETSRGPVVAVSFTSTKVTDAGLVHLVELKHLQTLALSST